MLLQSHEPISGYYAVVDASASPSLLVRLREAGHLRQRCLLRGSAEVSLAHEAPWLTEVDGALLSWLQQDAHDLPWGLLMEVDAAGPLPLLSPEQRFDATSRHLRGLLTATSPDGQRWMLRFYDPRLLPALLRVSTALEQRALFGPFTAIQAASGPRLTRPGDCPEGVLRTPIRAPLRLREEHMVSLATAARPRRALLTELARRDPAGSWTADGSTFVRRDAIGQDRLLLDGGGRPLALVTGLGARYELPHDAMGRPMAVVNPDGPRLSFEYERGHLAAIALGHRRRELCWDEAGRLTEERHLDGTSSRFVWTAGDQLRSHTDRLGATTRWVYDEQGRTVEQVDGLGRRTVISYGPGMGEVATTFPDGSVERHHLDEESGRLISQWAGGRRRLTLFDDAGAPTQEMWGDGRRVALRYSGSHLVEAENESARLTQRFDSDGRLVACSFDGGEALQTFDARGRLVERRLPDGEVHHFTWDADDRLIEARAWGRFVRWQHSPGGLTSRFTMGVEEAICLVGEEHHDGGGRLTFSWMGRPNGPPLSQQRYEYDSDWRPLVIQDECPSMGLNQRQSLVHDAEGHLLRVRSAPSHGQDHDFDYTLCGDLVSADGVAIETGQDGQITTIGGQRVAYDPGGRVCELPLAAGGCNLRWAEEDRLLGLSSASGDARCEYDPLGRLCAVHTPDGVWRLHWLGDQLLRERFHPRTGGPTVTRQWLCPPSATGSSLAAHTPLAFMDQGRAYWLQADARGATLRVLDEGGRVVWGATYDPFGEAQIHVEAVRQPWRLAGQYEVFGGLYYNRGRWYSPRLRQFLSRDPRWEESLGGAWNYCGNDPFSLVDPGGELAFLPVLAFIAVRIVVPIVVGVIVDYVVQKAMEAVGAVCVPCARLLAVVSAVLAVRNLSKLIKKLPQFARRLPDLWRRMRRSATTSARKVRNTARRWWVGRNLNPSDIPRRGAADDITSALGDIQQGRPRPNVRQPTPYDNDGRPGSQVLPTRDSSGNPVTYTEHTVNPRPPGQGLDGKRIVTGSDGNTYWTDDHYRTFNRF